MPHLFAPDFRVTLLAGEGRRRVALPLASIDVAGYPVPSNLGRLALGTAISRSRARGRDVLIDLDGKDRAQIHDQLQKVCINQYPLLEF